MGNKNAQRRRLKGSTVMPDGHMYAQRYTLQLNFASKIEATLTTAHWVGQNKNSKNRDCTEGNWCEHYDRSHVKVCL
jgi:hypothetical protein